MARRVTLHTRAGCHLCEEVLNDLRLLQVEADVELIIIDITQDPVLMDRYQYLIPVVDVHNGRILTPPITLEQLQEALGLPTIPLERNGVD